MSEKRYAVLIGDDKVKIPIKDLKKDDQFILYEPDGIIVGYFTAKADAYLYDGISQIYMITVKSGTLDERIDQRSNDG